MSESTGRCATIPAWLLISGVSGNAIKAYAILDSVADPESGEATPTRGQLAAQLGLSRAASVDQYVKELMDAGAIEKITRRTEKGDHAPNKIVVHREPRALTEEARMTSSADTSAALADTRLSRAARGLYLELVSYEAEGTMPTMEELKARGPEGRHALGTAIGQLRDLGYVTSTPRRDAGGRMTGSDWVLTAPSSRRDV